jgi:hypothetical protein
MGFSTAIDTGDPILDTGAQNKLVDPNIHKAYGCVQLEKPASRARAGSEVSIRVINLRQLYRPGCDKTGELINI